MRAEAYDDVAAGVLAERLGVPRLELFARVGSTQDVAHTVAAAGAPHGTVVLADTQDGGRGRAGRAWDSPAGAGLWLTLVARPRDAGSVEVLALRVGIALAAALDALAPAPVRVKWPNDLLVGAGKLAGILVEVRWQGARPEWAAVGVGVNVRRAPRPDAAALREDVSRLVALEAVVPALLAASNGPAVLTAQERAVLDGRDAVRGRRVAAPVAGTTVGIGDSGALLVQSPDGVVHEVRQTTVAYLD